MHSKQTNWRNVFTLHFILISNRKVHVLYVHVHKYYTKLNHSRGASIVFLVNRPDAKLLDIQSFCLVECLML